MSWIRKIVSQKKVRYVDSDYDLDMTYITSQIIAMGFPSQGFSQTYRNPLSVVAKYLDENHANHYKVFNLSEEPYPSASFSGPVEHYPFPDHHAPSLKLLLRILGSMFNWIRADRQNLVAVHCIAGMGRTGTLISCLLLLNEDEPNAELALMHFANLRTLNGVGVAHPSQIRAVYNFELHMRDAQANGRSIFEYPVPPQRTLQGVIVENLPPSFQGKIYLVLMDENFDPIFNSAWICDTPANSPGGANPVFTVGMKVQGDFTVKLFKANVSLGKAKPSEVLRSTNNTRFINGDLVTIPKLRLDGPHKDTSNEKFPDNFRIILTFETENGRSPIPSRVVV